jgi:hypothetical protein
MQDRISAIMVARLSVLTTIDFDDETSLKTGEIDNVWWDWELAAKAQAERCPTQFTPKPPLGICHGSPKSARTIAGFRTAPHIVAARA